MAKRGATTAASFRRRTRPRHRGDGATALAAGPRGRDGHSSFCDSAAAEFFAKSYIIDRACNVALETGKVSTAVVNIGGDLVIRGRSDDSVAIIDPGAAAENDEPLAYVTVTAPLRPAATTGGV